jgi:hypothetical protein
MSIENRTTADGTVLYSKWDSLVQKVHKKNSEFHKWKYFPLVPGAFGYDNLMHSVNEVMSTTDDASDGEKVHRGWVKNYVFWRDNPPKDTFYRMPYAPLGDERRNLCASTAYSDLPADEREKDDVIAKFIREG